MNLHEDPKIFRDAVRATAQQMGMLDIYVEKDYWITKALHVIFSSEIGKQVVFKGGTALSKCYGLIQRFSEDIDLVVLRSEEETKAKLKKKLKDISTALGTEMPEKELPGVTNKMGMIRKTAHEYPKIFKGSYGQVRNKLILESSWLGHYEPYHKQGIHSFVYEMMLKAGQEEMIEKYNLQPFSVQVLDIKRTLCEKILSLVRFSYSEQPIDELRLKIRHIYDLHVILQEKDMWVFFESPELEDMLNRVGNDDVEGYKNNNAWLKHAPGEALIFSKSDEVWKKLEGPYSTDFKGLVYGSLPAGSEILETLKKISTRVRGVKWRVKIV